MYYNLSCNIYRGFTEICSWERSTDITFHVWEEAEWAETLKVQEPHSKIPLYFSGMSEEKTNNWVGGREESR